MTILHLGHTPTLANADLDALLAGVPPLRQPSRLADYLGNNAGFNPMDFGGIGNGVNDDRTPCVDAGAGGFPLLLAPGKVHRIGANLTITSGIHSVGGKIKPAAGVTVTISGPVIAGDIPLFDLSAGGTVVLAPTSAAYVNAAWWGTVGDWNFTTHAGTDNTAAFQAMAAAMSGDISQGWRVKIPGGAYLVHHVTAFTRSFTTLEMLGVVLVFDPTADGEVCIDWNRGTELFGCKMIGGQIQSPPTNTKAKIGVRLVDVSDFDMDKVSTHNSFTSNARKDTNPSIGLVIEGREIIHIRRTCSFVADLPMEISRNPNARIELDTCMIEPANLTILGTSQAAVLIDDGCALLNTALLPGAAIEGGKDGVLWINQAGHGITSTNIEIGPFRVETTSDVTGYAVNLQTDASQIDGLVLRGIQPAFTNHGIKLRGCNNVRGLDFRFTGSGGDATRITLDINDTNKNVAFENTLIQAGVGYLFSNMRMAVAMGLSTDLLLPTHFVLRSTAQADNLAIVSDPAGGGGLDFSISGGTRVFQLRPGNTGVTNDGWTIYDKTNGKKLLYMDTANAIHIGQGLCIVEQTGPGVASGVYAYGADNIRYKNIPPNGGGPGLWVAG